MLYQFLLYSKMNQLYLHIYPLFFGLFLFRSQQSTEQSSLCYAGSSHQLSILYIEVYICQSQSPVGFDNGSSLCLWPPPPLPCPFLTASPAASFKSYAPRNSTPSHGPSGCSMKVTSPWELLSILGSLDLPPSL